MVPGRGCPTRPNFSVSWNLFNGIAPASRVAGTYYIYVKFLDGAGNATVGTLPAVQVNLTQGFSVPKIFLPEIPQVRHTTAY